MSWFNNSASRKMMFHLTLQFLLVALVPLLLILGPAYMTARELLTQQTHEKLAAKASSRQAIIQTYFYTMTRRAVLRADTMSLRNSLEAVDHYLAATGTVVESFDPKKPEYQAVWAQAHAMMLNVVKEGEYADVYLIDAASGTVMFNYSREPDLGTNLFTGPYRESNLAVATKKVIALNQVVVTDYAYYEAAKKPAMFILSPVHDRDGKIVAVNAVQFDAAVLGHIIGDRTGLGETGEVYIVGADMLMRSDSRFLKESTVLKRKVDTDSVRAALGGTTGVGASIDYRGESVVSHYSPLGIKDATGLEWVLVADMDTTEVYASVEQLGVKMLTEVLIGILAIVLVSWWLSRRLSEPLLNISNAVAQVAQGNLAVSIDPGTRTDEVAEIARSFALMTARLGQQATAISGNTSTIAAATAEITTSMAELASSVSETATAVAETSATTEEVKQTAMLASQKAQLVADSARRAVDLAGDSQGATDRTLTDLTQLQEQINGVAGRMYRLSEQTRSIGTVISTVNEIFDQANLLAVNAAIEAAKAGEHGRGFGVVAQEIRGLAERSRQAMTEIPLILGEIERAAAAAVSATETGTRSIDAVMTQSVAAGNVVRELAATLGEAAQAASQILVSGQQQVIGMNQVAGAIESIRLASAQNADGARAVQESSRALDQVGRDLQNIVEWYKV